MKLVKMYKFEIEDSDRGVDEAWLHVYFIQYHKERKGCFQGVIMFSDENGCKDRHVFTTSTGLADSEDSIFVEACKFLDMHNLAYQTRTVDVSDYIPCAVVNNVITKEKGRGKGRKIKKT